MAKFRGQEVDPATGRLMVAEESGCCGGGTHGQCCNDTLEPTEDALKEAAYYLWEQAGANPDDDPMEYWEKARKKLTS